MQLEERSNDDVAAFIAAFMHFANVIEESKSVIGKQFKFPNELIDILISYALPMNAYHQVMAFLDTFKNKKATQWSQIK